MRPNDDLTDLKLRFAIDELVLSNNYTHQLAAVRLQKVRRTRLNKKRLTTKMKRDLNWVRKNVSAMEVVVNTAFNSGNMVIVNGQS